MTCRLIVHHFIMQKNYINSTNLHPNYRKSKFFNETGVEDANMAPSAEAQ